MQECKTIVLVKPSFFCLFVFFLVTVQQLQDIRIKREKLSNERKELTERYELENEEMLMSVQEETKQIKVGLYFCCLSFSWKFCGFLVTVVIYSFGENYLRTISQIISAPCNLCRLLCMRFIQENQKFYLKAEFLKVFKKYPFFFC